ncbi:serine--tRNA ligase [Candidatus Woesearchaeota archaeon]|nr:serine--tRNA ligase [Candidatus Woesearchaeota archaeon]
MLDINYICENPELVKENLKNKFQEDKLKLVDEVVKAEKELKKERQKNQELRHRRNVLSNEINAAKKKNQKIEALLKEAKELPKALQESDKIISELESTIKQGLLRIPNIIHSSVPLGKDDAQNVEIKHWGKPKKFSFELKNHSQLAEDLGVADFERSTKISGSGFYFLKGKLGLLNQALIRFAIDHLVKKGYTYVEPPLVVKRKAYEGVVSLEDFENVMYKVDGEDDKDEESLYLIATSEHSLVPQYMNEVISEDKLPIKLVGYSMCFRKEVGSHGVDTRGLFRTHQFNKVEQIIFCKPEESYHLYNELLKNSEEIFKALKLPYRVVEICSGDLSLVKAKSADIEVWMPRQNAYKEVCSLTNCTDYQARRLNIRCENNKGDRRILHTLNNTAIATSRAIVAILENYQKKDGSIDIPKVLWKYCGFKKIP